MPDAARADRRRLGEHAEPAERGGIGTRLLGLLEHELAREPVEPRDAALAVVAREARVGCVLGARDAVAARAPHGRATRSPFEKPSPSRSTSASDSCPSTSRFPPVRRDAEQPLGDLAVGPADADLEHAQQDAVAGAARRCPRPAPMRDARLDDERLHCGRQAAVDREDRAGHELGGREVDDRVRDLLGRAEASHRLARAQRVERLAGVLDEASHPRRVDRPGQTALTRIPSPTWSIASARVSATTAPFDAEYAARFRSPTSAATDATLTIEPPPRAIMPGIACLQQRNVPRALTANTFSQTSSGVPGAFVVEPMPAALTSTSTPSIACATCCLVADVEPNAVAPSSVATASGSRSATVTSKPSSASRRATAAPIPDPPPVTRALIPA